MLGHDFAEMPTRGKDGLTETLLRCRWCFKTPISAREDGCPIRELETVGRILLLDYNPDGRKRFAGRMCITCNQPIMMHELRKGSSLYWCHYNQNQSSEGIAGCVWDVAGVTVPAELEIRDWGAE